MKVSVGRGNLEQMLYHRDTEIHLFYRKQQKMRKAVTHFLETSSAGVLRYRSNLQDKAKRSESLGCDYKTYFSGQVFNHQVNGFLHGTGVSAPHQLSRAEPIPRSSSACSHLLLSRGFNSRVQFLEKQLNRSSAAARAAGGGCQPS